MEKQLLNLKEVAVIIGKHPKYIRMWINSPRGERFRRVVKEVEPNSFNAKSVYRYVDGANF